VKRLFLGPPDATRFVVGSTACLGVITSIGLLGGLLGIKSTTGISGFVVVAAGALSGWYLSRRLEEPVASRGRGDLVILALPTLFVASALRWLVRPPSIRLSWLFDTWDGTTNPGVVTYSMVSGNIGHDTSILSQWETYPRAPHFAIGQLARVAEGIGFTSASDRATLYAVGLWVTYALVLAAVGVVMVRLAGAMGVNERAARPFAVVAQSFLLLSTNLEKTLFLHSLSFLACIAACLSLVVLWLSISSRGELTWRSLFLISLHVVIVVETFPLMLPFVAIILMVLLVRFRSTIPTHSVTSMSVLLVPLAIAAPRLIDQFRHSSKTDHVSTGGHLLALSEGTAISIGLFGVVGAVLLMRSRGVGRSAAAVLLGAILVPATAWMMVGNFDRTYGVNYYPKKVELFTLVVVVAMAPAPLVGLLRRVLEMLSVRAVGTALTAVAALAVWNGPLTAPRLVASSDPARRYIVATFDEANRASESVIFGSNVMMSTYASMMANLIDKEYWTVGYTNDRLLTIFQQLSVAKPDTSVEDLCRVVSRRPADVSLISERRVTRTRCRP